jgi:hypothetical protein
LLDQRCQVEHQTQI